MSQKALAYLSCAMSFHAQRREAIAAEDLERADMYARWRDENLTLAGLPIMAEIDAAFDAFYASKPVDGARKPRTAQPRPSIASLIQAVREHALANYGKDGWDYLVECWDDSDIEKAIGNARTYAGAIKACRATVRLLDERRAEVLSEVW